MFLNTPCSHLCVTGMSGCIATRVTLIEMSHGRLGEGVHGVCLLLFHFSM
jgi:hypothetical protein